MKCYLRNLLSTDMAKKASLEVDTPTLSKLLTFTEHSDKFLNAHATLALAQQHLRVEMAQCDQLSRTPLAE